MHFWGFSYFAIVEEFIDGRSPKTWSDELTYALGKDLAHWHGVVLSKAAAMAIGIRRRNLAYAAKARLRQLDETVQKQLCG